MFFPFKFSFTGDFPLQCLITGRYFEIASPWIWHKCCYSKPVLCYGISGLRLIEWNLDENARGWASLKNVDQHMFLQISIQKVWSNVRLSFQRKSHCIKCLCPAPLNLHCSMFEHHSLQMQICRSILSVTRICRPFILSGPFLVIAGEVGNCLRCA